MLVLLASTLCRVANADTLTLNPITQLTLDNSVQWQTISPHPANNTSFLLVSENGALHSLSTGDIESTQLLSLEQISRNATQLTAVALHPSFSLRDQPGYHTFYTAHIEPIDNSRRRPRLQNAIAELTFDIVITEWQMLNTTVDIDSKREILRIGVPSKQTYINQLAFSPLSKVWNDDFGLLYAGLKADAKYGDLPLYSGAILRIDPKKFGLRNYTVPPSNPFLMLEEVDNELFIVGLQDLIKFIWPDKNDNHLLTQHIYNKQSQLTLVKPGNDYRKTAPRDILYTSSDSFLPNGLISYRGRSLAHLWGSVLFMTQTNERMKLHSLVMPDSTGKVRAPVQEWQSQTLSTPEKLELYRQANQEVIVFNKTAQQLYQLSPIESPNKDSVNTMVENAQPQDEDDSNSFLFTFFCIGLIAIWLFWTYKRNKSSARYIVKQQLTNFEISESKQHISLYRHHEDVAECTLAIGDIIESKLILNDAEVSLINLEHAFSNNNEETLREQFNKEKREKMVSGRIRQVDLVLVDNDKHEYSICSYLRKGDNRITRRKYTMVIEQLIDWNWLFSATLAPELTEKRQPHVTTKPKPASLEGLFQPQNNTFSTYSNDNDSMLKSIDTATQESSKSHLKSFKSQSVAEQQHFESESLLNETDNKETQTHNTDVSEARIKADAELVQALEKLAHLKQQGMLTEQEYQSAKQKILDDLLH